MKMTYDQRNWLMNLQHAGIRITGLQPDGDWITLRKDHLFLADRSRYKLPTQRVPDRVDWREFCRKLQSKGVIFELRTHNGTWGRWLNGFNFGSKQIGEYRIPEQPIPEWKEEPMALKQQEHDPNGLAQNEPGAKLDAGKIQAALVLGGFAKALEEVSKVGTFGAKKYSPNGWKSVEDGANRYSDAMMRHWLAHQSGELIDADSGLSHLSQVAWNALAVLQLTVGAERVE